MFHIGGGIFLGFLAIQAWCKFWDARAARKERKRLERLLPQWQVVNGRFVLPVEPKRHWDWGVTGAVIIFVLGVCVSVVGALAR